MKYCLSKLIMMVLIWDLQKGQLKKNDLPSALEILSKWQKGIKVENRLALYVTKEKNCRKWRI